MRLSRLDLTRYGKFTDHTVDFGPAGEEAPDLHIVYGLNEAGKSTIFAAYLDLLFGMGDQNRYNFKHDYNAMQIGARLEFDGGAHELVRIKKRVNSLLDDGRQPVNEAMLMAALGGIHRDAYRTMFSLDDQSLQDGGNAIVQSKGELGELLFSASSGLAGLSKSLVTASEEAGALYKKRSSGTRLAELKRTLGVLKAERDAIDTFATAHQALMATYAQTEASYNTAMSALAAARTRHAELGRILGAMPLAHELARLSEEHAALGDMPRPPSEWFALLPQLSANETRLQALLESADRNIDQRVAEIAEIAVDERMLAIGTRMAGLDDGRARYRTAETDLPRRHLAAAEQDAELSRILIKLEQAEHGHAENLLLPASQTGILHDLIETRSGVDAELVAADRELKRAGDSLERFREEGLAEFAGAEAIPADSLADIALALANLDRTDLPSRLAVEARALAQLRHAYEDHRALLAPWSGDAETLLSLRIPELRQIESWAAQAAAINRRMADHQAKHRELITEHRQTEARIAAFETEGPIDDGEARKLRKDRDLAWEEHLVRLDSDSAKLFEGRMHADDAVSSQRLSRTQELAELRQLKRAISTQAAAIERQEELLAEATAESAALAEKVDTILPPGILTGTEPSERLVALETWAKARLQTLAAWDALRRAERGLAEIRSELAQHGEALTAGLQNAGVTGVDRLSIPELTTAATDLVSREKIRNAAQLTHEKTLLSLEKDLAGRRRDRDDRKILADSWQHRWNETVAGTWFADKAGSVAAVREILNVLSTLPGVLREREQMMQRIVTMERDQASFRADIAAILAELGEDLDKDDVLGTADALLGRHQAALRAQQSRSDRQADLDRMVADRRLLDDQLAVHNARKAEVTAFFDTDTLAAVSLHLEQVRDRERLEMRIAELRQQIATAFRTQTFDVAETLLSTIDAADLERESAELSARIDDLSERTRHLYADMTRARDKLDAVGGDDAVARIEAQRRTIFLEIEDLAIRYLKLRAGTLAAEQALHIYREKHRSAMMNRASDAFRTITGGNYAGLAVRPDKDREILIGVARDGSSKLADAMSTGTRFQLYLALRLAGYEEFAAVRPSVPFIADDIMESFDNPRSEEVFRLLGEMARVGQVIYLTHHWHLCEIARSVVPGVKIHELP